MHEAGTGPPGSRELLGVGAVSSTASPRAFPEGSREAELFMQNKSFLLNGLIYEKYKNSVRKIILIEKYSMPNKIF